MKHRRSVWTQGALNQKGVVFRVRCTRSNAHEAQGFGWGAPAARQCMPCDAGSVGMPAVSRRQRELLPSGAAPQLHPLLGF